MNILFLTIGMLDSINQRGGYSDLLRALHDRGNNVYGVCAREKRQGLPTEVLEEDGTKILKVRVGNITKSGFIEKGLATLRIEKQYADAINEYFKGVKFDLIIYTTPPITLYGVVNRLKRTYDAKTLLLLKDIFPQNAVDIGMMSKTGLKAPLYKYFRRKEKKLYAISDHIGCMSQANVEYALKHNSEISESKVSVIPNCIEVFDRSIPYVKDNNSVNGKFDLEKNNHSLNGKCSIEKDNNSKNDNYALSEVKDSIRDKYNLPKDKIIFVYGGNLGKPQDIGHIIKCLRSQKENDRAFFLIVGNGTEYHKLEEFCNTEKQDNVMLMSALPKEEYDSLIAACDVGLLFLDHRFTIPNFPSRLLDYMQVKIPVLACTDRNTDVGKVITENGFGWWCESRDAKEFAECVKLAMKADREAMGQKAYECLKSKYDVEKIVEENKDLFEAK